MSGDLDLDAATLNRWDADIDAGRVDVVWLTLCTRRLIAAYREREKEIERLIADAEIAAEREGYEEGYERCTADVVACLNRGIEHYEAMQVDAALDADSPLYGASADGLRWALRAIRAAGPVSSEEKPT